MALSTARVSGPSSRTSTAVGKSLGSVLMAKPNSVSCKIGTNSMVAKVMRSRRICTNSLTIIAHMRPMKPGSRSPLAPLSASAPLTRNCPRFLHQHDEHVFERWLSVLPAMRAVSLPGLGDCRIEGFAVAPADMQLGTARRYHVDAAHHL